MVFLASQGAVARFNPGASGAAFSAPGTPRPQTGHGGSSTPLWASFRPQPSRESRLLLGRATEPVPSDILRFTDWIRGESDSDAVFLVAGDLFQWIPTYSGRRTLIAPADVLTGLHGFTLDAQAAKVVPVVDYIVWDPEVTAAAATNRLVLEALPDWRLEYRDGHLHVYGRNRVEDSE